MHKIEYRSGSELDRKLDTEIGWPVEERYSEALYRLELGITSWKWIGSRNVYTIEFESEEHKNWFLLRFA